MGRTLVVGLLVMFALSGCLALQPPTSCPTVGVQGDSVSNPACVREQASGLTLSLVEGSHEVEFSITNGGDETAHINPDRWTVFRRDGGTWLPVANTGGTNMTAFPLAPGETWTTRVRYDPETADSPVTTDRVLAQPGEYVFSFAARNATLTASFEVGS